MKLRFLVVFVLLSAACSWAKLFVGQSSAP